MNVCSRTGIWETLSRAGEKKNEKETVLTARGKSRAKSRGYNFAEIRLSPLRCLLTFCVRNATLERHPKFRIKLVKLVSGRSLSLAQPI